MCKTVAHLIQSHSLQVTRSIALLILIQELLVIAQELVANGCGLVVGRVVTHVGKDAACKVDVATPPVGLIISLVSHQPATLDDLSVQAKYIQGGVVAAAQHQMLCYTMLYHVIVLYIF